MHLIVSNIDTRLNDENLRNLFAAHGEVESATIAMDAFTEQSRGFGYVDMPQEEQARAAIAALNQSELDGRVISVKEAEPQAVRRGSYKVGNGAVNVYRFKKN